MIVFTKPVTWAMRQGKRGVPIRHRLIVFLLPAALIPASALADVAAGVAAFEEGNYERAVEEWLIAAGQGDPNALFNLGQAYRLGKGVDKDMAKAEVYYRRAAEAGHPAAMGNLANLYYFSKDPPRRKDAHALWRDGARAGDARSQYMLGALTFNGEFGERDLAKGYAWTWLAARTGFDKARESLATMKQYVPAEAQANAERTAPDLMSDDGRQYWRATLSDDGNAPDAPLAGNAQEAGSMTEAPIPSEAPADPKAAGDGPVFRINLATMRRKEGALTIWQRHLDAHADILAGMSHRLVPVSDDEGVLYRLQAGVFPSAEEAGAVCNKLQAQDVGCFVVRTPE